MCSGLVSLIFFFFKQKTAYEMRISDWSSDVCSSDLVVQIDLVGTAQDRHRIVDHHHVLAVGAMGRAVGMIVERGGLADEQAVVFGKPGKIVLGDRIDFDAQFLAGIDKDRKSVG